MSGKPFILQEGQIDQFGFNAALKKRTNGNRQTYGITTYLQRFTVYEDMFSKFMYCEGIIYDGTGFFSKIGFQTGDILEITIFKDKNDTAEDRVENEYYIESINSNAKLVGTKGANYEFRAVSKIGWVGLTGKLKKSYKGKVSDIVAYLAYNEPFKISPPKKLMIQQTYGKIVIDAPSIKPFEFIDKLNSYALVPSNPDNNFFWFETRVGLVYKNLKRIANDADVFNYHIMVDKNKNTKEALKDYHRIQEYQLKKVNDQLTMYHEGAIDNKTLTYNFLTRKIKTRENSYSKSLLLMGQHFAFDPEESKNIRETKKNEEEQVYVRCSSESYPEEKLGDRPELPSKKWGPSIIQYNMMNQTVLTAKIIGNPYIKPGDIIYIKEAATPQGDEQEEKDPLLSGRFLVGSARHIVMDAKEYTTILDLYKDGYEQDISTYRRDIKS